MAIKEEKTFEDRNKLRDTLSEKVIKNLRSEGGDNMNGESRANDKLMAKVSYGKELDKLPGNSIQEKIEKALGIKVMPSITLKEALELLKKNK